jgi:hypothetical protein
VRSARRWPAATAFRVLRDDGSPEPLAALELVPVGRAVAVRTLREAAWSDAEQAYLVPLAAK